MLGLSGVSLPSTRCSEISGSVLTPTLVLCPAQHGGNYCRAYFSLDESLVSDGQNISESRAAVRTSQSKVCVSAGVVVTLSRAGSPH